MADISIQHFYGGRSVFVTGVTGFMGKVLVEKLLRSCSDIDKIYLMIRTKREVIPSTRLQELISNSQAFEWLRQNQPDTLKKLIPISGDVSLSNLGISPTDMRELIDNVSVVFHLAARVKLDNNLREAMDCNVKGPKRVAILCQQLKNLKVLVHVSTTYSNVDKKELAEQIYPASLDPQKLMDLVDSMDDQLLASSTKQLIGNSPNVYAYTKALGENVLEDLAQCEGSFPLVIVRPSTVIAAIREPIPGWVDDFNGHSGLLAGMLKGFINTVKANAELITDLMPVDIPINLMIAAAWDKGIYETSNETISVYNCSSGTLNPIRWWEFKLWGMRAFDKFPCKEMMRCPSVEIRTNNLIYEIELALYHKIPAFFMDAVIRLSGKKPFLTRLYQRTHKVMSCVEFYNLREWQFVSRNASYLMGKMSDDDRNTFNFDVRQIDWESYLEVYVSGVRQFLIKDDLGTLPAARNNLKRMKRFRALVRLFMLGLVLFFFYAIWWNLFTN
ncbi:putative fatty acyl-CoA reductase CG5065 [Daphnia pulicaria]|uniref:putative fatty acyl-CoA reductase CG5065 n=1 Tax=Daphnia pulicaria TaxID=35523 RepID=UPI001EEA0AAE|nr:putative fatty acyl-CoA reductase CG5065 [Daphnia pulicaria]